MVYDIGGEKRLTIFQHPGSQITERIKLPSKPLLKFGLGIDPAVWNSGQSDGIQFRVFIQKPGEQRKYLVFDRFISLKEHQQEQTWEDVALDLSRFGGDTVDIIFETLPGPNNDNAFDWGGWGAPFIVDRGE